MSDDRRGPRRGAPTPNPSPTGREGGGRGAKDVTHQPRDPSWERWSVPSGRKRRMRDAARELRKNMTPTERILWEAVRANRLDGRKFRRQQSVGSFIVDFYCASERLVVEVDGDVYATQKERDERRQEALEALGLHFVRIPARQVTTDLPSALAAIRRAFGRIPFRTRDSDAAETGPGRPSEEEIAEFRRNDPASRWMQRMSEQRRMEAEARSGATDGPPLPHPSPPVGEGPGVGAPTAADGTAADSAPSDFARTDPVTRWMWEQMDRMEVAR